MRRTKHKRFLALLLVLATMLPLAAQPARASQFWDINDAQTSLAADVLSSLGVVGGTGGGGFSPEGHLTRAQLCKMAVEIMGMGEQAKSLTYRTIFKDMGSGHWARGYVNLAATTEVSEGSRLMLGLGDGNFGPDREVTYQETVTLALRLLGYSEEANKAWPYSALETATQLGLDKDLNVEAPSAPITRGQTAQLFYRLLTTPAKGETKPFADGRLGTLVDDAIVLDVDATINGQSGWVVTVKDGARTSYRRAAPLDSSLLGLRGAALLDEEGRFVTILPDESSYITAAVSRKQGFYLYLAGHGRYTLSENTPVYTGSGYDSGVTTYEDYMANLKTGDMVTIYLDKGGKVAGLFRSEASAETRFVVVRSSTASAGMFRSLMGEEKNYTIRKNGSEIPMSGIKRHDVVTYDAVSKVLEVCDAKLACVYENAVPTPGSPNEVIAAGGNHFSVLADAMGDFTGRKLGENITLLFTANGMVAGLIPGVTDASSSNALGIINKDGHFELLNCRLTLTESVPTERYNLGSIWNICSTRRGELSLQSNGVYSGGFLFNPKNMTLGGTKVSAGVQVFEREADGTLVARDVSSMTASSHSAYYHRNSAGEVDMIILDRGPGDALLYGRIDVLNGHEVTEVGANVWRRSTVQRVQINGEKTEYGVLPGKYFASGYCAISLFGDMVASVSYLKQIKDVPSSAFYVKDGTTYVRIEDGTIYEVDKDVQCFNIAASYTPPNSYYPTWLDLPWENDEWTGIWRWDSFEWYPDAPKIETFDSLGECRNFSDTLVIYIDTEEQKVRVVEALQ